MDALHVPEFSYLGWIVLFPLVGALINGIAGSQLPRKVVHWVGCGTIGLSFLVSLASGRLLLLNGHEVGHGHETHTEYGYFTYQAFEWIAVGDLQIDIAFLLDPLSAVMILVITGVGFVIHLYSVGYMEDDPGVWRYFAYLNLFCFAMLMLVLGKNFLVTFIGWEGVGLCSYLLIGFWYEDDDNAQAGQKAFIVNRIGDFAFIAGLFLIWYATGTFDYVELQQPGRLAALAPIALPASLLIFVGCTGKSAQIPLYTWLPDAMAGPTPVSALIHAATMVTAGVFLLSRLHFMFTIDPAAGLIVAVVGVLTAFFAATIAVVQNDIKSVLAYSTISQLGYMFIGVGVGAFGAAIFHLMTHAFFKALLFLGSGSVIHSMGGEQDIRKMGGLRKWMPITAGTFFVACLAISGVPLFSGWFSKDLILWNSLSNIHIFHYPATIEWLGGADVAKTSLDVLRPEHAGGAAFELPEEAPPATFALVAHWGIYILGVLTAGLTAFYMFRLYFLTFEGECRADEETKEHLHESPPSMTVPLVVLAILSVIGGYIGWPHFVPKGWLGGAEHHAPEWASWMLGFEHWLDEVFASSTATRFAGQFGSHPFGLEMAATAVSSVVALSGIAAAWWVYLKKPGLPKEIADSVQGLYRLLSNKYWVDEFYQRVFVEGTLKVGGYFYAFDRYVIDGLFVNGIGWLAEQFGRILGYLQGGNVQRYATYFIVALALFALWLLYL